MADFYGSDSAVWSEEHDSVPLKQRLKLRFATNRTAALLAISDGIIVKKEYEECNSQDFHSNCTSQQGKSRCLTLEQSPTGETKLGKYTSHNQISAGEIITASLGNYVLPSLSSNFPGKVKVEQSDDNGMSTLDYCVKNGSFITDEQATDKCMAETAEDVLDDFDHVVLKDRQRMLLSRRESSSAPEARQDDSSGWCGRMVDALSDATTGIGQYNTFANDKVLSFHGNNFNEVSKSKAAGSEKMVAEVPCMIQVSSTPQYCEDDKISSSGENGDFDSVCSFKNVLYKQKSNSGPELSIGDSKSTPSSDVLELVNVKVEPFNSSDLEGAKEDSARTFVFPNVVQVKTEFVFADDSLIKDELDHMFLSERIKLLSSKNLPHLDICGNSTSSSKLASSALNSQPIASLHPKPFKISRSGKRRKTATDSVGTALEEDAPGLLQVLVEKGVSVDEMKLYGQEEYDGALDESSIEDSFSELEAVISKLFFQRTSLLKFAPIRCNKGEKASYCLTCLFSLVEQARYLRFRNWPVEWGWCRDLQAFIFVFKRHNRIVLERPEYGYATYFFELLDSASIDWQIKRLVTAMKLTSCSRVTLLENKALMIGEDLTEGEAQVLTEYGWIPNSGLGTMLNYRDRVVHDRKNEKNISEWRSKIGKLLMDGYNGGRIVSVDILDKLSEYNVNQRPEIKLELS